MATNRTSVMGIATPYMACVFANDILRSIALDFVFFLVVDVVAKAAIGDPSHAGDARKKAVWLIEGICLFVICVVVYLYHHPPVMLVIACIVTLSFAQPWQSLRGKWQNSRASHRPAAQPFKWADSDDEDEGVKVEMKCERMSSPSRTVNSLRRRPLYGAQSFWGIAASPQAGKENAKPAHGRSLPLIGQDPKPIHPRNPSQPIMRPYSIGQRLRGLPQGIGSLIRSASSHCGTLTASATPSLGSYQLPFMHLYSVREGKPMPPGLPNGGRNLCFMNCVLQCLAHCPGFEAQLSEVSRSIKVPPHELAFPQALSAVLRECQLTNHMAERRLVSTDEFRAVAAKRNRLLVAPPTKPQIQAQHDAGEFMLWLLDTVHMILSKSRPEISTETASEIDNDRIAAHLEHALTGKHMNGDESTLENLTIPSLRELVDCCRQAIDVGDARENQFYVSVIQLMAEAEWLIHQQSCPSVIQSMFECQSVAARHCLSCNRVSVTLEPVRMLHLPIPTRQHTVLSDCLEQFGQIEQMAGQNLLRCHCAAPSPRPPSGLGVQSSPMGGLRPGLCRSLVRKLPPCLVLQLMRFEYNAMNGTPVKLNTSVDFPVSGLNLANIFYEDAVSLPHPPGSSVLYDLCAMAIHVGDSNPSFGHYYAYCHESDSHWYKFNDEVVTQVNDFQRECSELFVRQNVYLLFYTFRPV